MLRFLYDLFSALCFQAERFEKNQCKYIEVAPKVLCKGTQHLEVFFQDVMDRGGEGVILRDPKSVLAPGRSAGYLKHKVFNFIQL